MNFNQTVYQVLENMSNFEDVFKRLGHIEQAKMIKIFDQTDSRLSSIGHFSRSFLQNSLTSPLHPLVNGVITVVVMMMVPQEKIIGGEWL